MESKLTEEQHLLVVKKILENVSRSVDFYSLTLPVSHRIELAGDVRHLAKLLHDSADRLYVKVNLGVDQP